MRFDLIKMIVVDLVLLAILTLCVGLSARAEDTVVTNILPFKEESKWLDNRRNSISGEKILSNFLALESAILSGGFGGGDGSDSNLYAIVMSDSEAKNARLVLLESDSGVKYLMITDIDTKYASDSIVKNIRISKLETDSIYMNTRLYNLEVFKNSISDTYIRRNVYDTMTGLTVTGQSEFKGNVQLGDFYEDNIYFIGRVNSDIKPPVSNTYDLGDGSFRWRRIYAKEVYFDTLYTDSTQAAGTTSEDYYINSDNATLDTEIMKLSFNRGLIGVNAEMSWQPDSQGFVFNFPVYADTINGRMDFGSLYNVPDYSNYYVNIIGEDTKSGRFNIEDAQVSGLTLNTNKIIFGTTNFNDDYIFLDDPAGNDTVFAIVQDNDTIISYGNNNFTVKGTISADTPVNENDLVTKAYADNLSYESSSGSAGIEVYWREPVIFPDTFTITNDLSNNKLRIARLTYSDSVLASYIGHWNNGKKFDTLPIDITTDLTTCGIPTVIDRTTAFSYTFWYLTINTGDPATESNQYSDNILNLMFNYNEGKVYITGDPNELIAKGYNNFILVISYVEK